MKDRVIITQHNYSERDKPAFLEDEFIERFKTIFGFRPITEKQLEDSLKNYEPLTKKLLEEFMIDIFKTPSEKWDKIKT